MNKFRLIAFPFAFLLMLFTTFSAYAGDFAEKHVVLQISDGSPQRQTLVLNVANNLIKHYGQDAIDVEIVAFGPGLKILFANNEVSAPRIDGLVSNGVKFSACSNTIAGIKRKTGKEPVINKNATKVSAGVVRIMDLVAKNYTLIKP